MSISEKGHQTFRKSSKESNKDDQGMSNAELRGETEFCGLTTLETRRVRGDLIETYKILTNKVDVPPERFLVKSHYHGTRGHNMKLFFKRVGKRKQNFYSASVVDRWNELEGKIDHSVS